MRLFASLALCAIALPAAANDFLPQLEAMVEAELAAWATDPAIVAAITARNTETAAYSEARILELDNAWRSEVGTGSTPTIDIVMGAPLSAELQNRVNASMGRLTEVFVMDAVGLNVAASGVTSDMWQGDEAKWQETYPRGAGAVHYGEVEFDESTQQYLTQISMTVVDPATGQAIGAITFGVNAESLL